MRTRQRLSALKQWTYERLCKGRTMKAPAEGMDITQIVRQEPQVFLAWQPTRPDMTSLLNTDPLSVCPGILIMRGPRMPNTLRKSDLTDTTTSAEDRSWDRG